MTLIAPFISEKEYRCPCCGSYPPDFFEKRHLYNEIFKTFEGVRNLYGKPIRITSGYRCPKYNKQIGGARFSVHMWGLALDLHCDDINDMEYKAQLIRRVNPDVRMGLYYDDTFIHMDVGFNIEPRVTNDWSRGINWIKGRKI